MLTVEEAARVARIGRTKAYAMAREWRDTGGRSGLPVVDFGHVLRVPRRALEELIGAELTEFPGGSVKERTARDVEPAVAEPAARVPSAAPAPRASTPRTRRHRDATNQLDLFTPAPIPEPPTT
jgi:hypothetical protein